MLNGILAQNLAPKAPQFTQNTQRHPQRANTTTNPINPKYTPKNALFTCKADASRSSFIETANQISIPMNTFELSSAYKC